VSNIEEHIRKAMREGKFDNLPGKGKPLRLSQNPHEDPEWRLAHHVLRENGFTLPWIERLREIETELEEARATLLRTWGWRQAASTTQEHSSSYIELEWRQAETDFRQRVEALNKQIAAYNLEVPLDRFQKRRLSADLEIARLTLRTPSDKL